MSQECSKTGIPAFNAFMRCQQCPPYQCASHASSADPWTAELLWSPIMLAALVWTLFSSFWSWGA